MKIVTKLFIVFILFGCLDKANEEKKSIKSTKVDLIKNEPKFDYYSDNILAHIDAEELCEFNFEFFVPKLNRILANENLVLNISTTENSNTSFEVLINQQKINLYSNKELSNGEFWKTGPSRFFKTINSIISKNRINKQFYLLYSANDLHAIFLSKDQFKSMSEINKNNKNEIPYSP